MVYIVIALVLAIGGLVYLLMSSPSSNDITDNAAKPTTPVKFPNSANGSVSSWPPPSPTVAQDTKPRAPDGVDPTRDLTSYVARGEKPTVAEVIDRLHQAGVYSGIGAFNPPGTRPAMIGLAVPEDFVLPKGYVRHHQATDDGQRIEAILMFAPDYQPLDANNQPIEVPKNRVVPPELAPAGLPIRRITLPTPIEPPRSGP